MIRGDAEEKLEKIWLDVNKEGTTALLRIDRNDQRSSFCWTVFSTLSSKLSLKLIFGSNL
jgi:hypothetical protein